MRARYVVYREKNNKRILYADYEDANVDGTKTRRLTNK